MRWSHQGIVATMALKSLVLFSLLVLVLLVLEGAQAASVQDFQRKHLDPRIGPFSRNYCTQMMRNRKLSGRVFNTFVHQTLAAVQAVCREPNIPCKNTKNNCHRSPYRMRITDCILTRHRPIITYTSRHRSAYIVVACFGKPPMPVHFDGSR
ncbi:ribonuclease pancreatic-like [Talpa occidentalis]|uniref:ribonuclease pancreatic-like n=1 Tax=Talpa occidentalis TaxID=50954 RepID=UPI00188ED069|nr:ribonuclease pancreatic-like [Talpa occidentalis]